MGWQDGIAIEGIYSGEVVSSALSSRCTIVSTRFPVILSDSEHL